MISRINPLTGIVEQLIDMRNINMLSELIDRIEFTEDAVVGLDIETHDADRHDGLNQFMEMNPKSNVFKKPRKLVFDTNRTTLCGGSIYLRGDDTVYYINVAHADVENRIPKEIFAEFVKKVRDNSLLIIHNYQFEFVMLMKTVGVDIGKNYVDTMQLAVSAYNSDEYDIERFKKADLGGIKAVLPIIKKTFAGYFTGKPLTTEQVQVMNMVIGKQSIAAHSYNGYVRSLRYGYGLKEMSEKIFGYEQTTFKDALLGRAHMGQVTGEEILHYGADDAYWCVRCFDWLMQFVQKTNPQLLNTFFTQENPMVRIFGKSWIKGWRVNLENIEKRNLSERKSYARELLNLSNAIAEMSFMRAPSARLSQKNPKWYLGKTNDKYQIYRNKIQFLLDGVQEICDDFDLDHITSDDLENEQIAFELCQLTSGSVSKAWLYEQDVKLKKAELDKRGNYTHYMVMRTLLHDLCMLPFVYIKGEIKSDGEARGTMLEMAERLKNEPELWIKEWNRYGEHTNLPEETRLKLAQGIAAAYPTETVKRILSALNRIAEIEQRIKLFVTSYRQLTDPETERMYPVISSLLNTRRMAAENPNTMQLSKQGESTYVRGFFLPENDEHLLVAIDWSQVELVLIGEDSLDPAFKKAYGQIPYQDLHLGAAAAALKVFYPEFTEENLLSIKSGNDDDILQLREEFPKVFVDPVKKNHLENYQVLKFWRGTAGKPSNFGYWYSGSLMTVQEKLGWTNDEMWEGTDNYRLTFRGAEIWRKGVIEEVGYNGYVNIFDGHRRVRYEATNEWFYEFTNKWAAYNDIGLSQFGYMIAKKIQRRAGNQSVNAKIQGGCATLAKRSIIRLDETLETGKWDANFIMPIHDELIFSVHYTQAVEFSKIILKTMCDHPDLVSELKLDGTISIGKTLEPYHPVKAPFGQIELDEAPHLEGYIPESLADTKLDDAHRQRVVDYLMNKD